MLTLKNDYLVYCKCIEEYIKFENCNSCVNYTLNNFIDLNDDKKKYLYCSYKENDKE